ncbi:hypothetical protein TRVA0_018S01926 [Trichomonascus vanleenenianus]|uniref:uncharacterized protein n=1 Tax=Trichomonascus vanleenenianus TaxID=2268995 RepID=UPI003EC9EA35
MSRLRRATKRLLDQDASDDSDGHIYDEEEQERILKSMRSKADESEEQFKLAFVTLMLFPTPLFILLPYCRNNGVLSLLSLVSISLSAYSLHFVPTRDQSHTSRLAILSALFSLVIAASGYIKHHPWKGFDYIWLLPLVSAITALLVRRWLDETSIELDHLSQARYKLKGA